MAHEEDSSSISEEFDENPSLQELIDHVGNISTKIRRKKENLEEFVASMKNENSINKTVVKRFQGIEGDFKDGRKTKSELKDLQKKLSGRIDEVDEKVERIQQSLDYITSKERQIKSLHEQITKLTDDTNQDELVKLKYEIQSLFSEIKIKFRESKKIKLSLLTKFKPDDLIQSVKSWEKAAETARDINRKVVELQHDIEERTAAMNKIEDELRLERKKSKEQEKEMLRITDDMKTEEESKAEQADLINTFRSLLDESEKLARNLEAQNTNLNHIITGEKERVSELRNKISDLQNQIDKEHKSNREMSLQHEHMKAGFLAATAENEGYARDMAAIRKELDAIKALQNQQQEEKSQKDDDEETLRDQIDDLEEKLQISDKMLQAKYLEAETLQTDLDKTSERVVELETKVTVMNEQITKLIETVEIRDREASQLTELLKDTQTALESEKLAKDQYVIKCEVLEQKLALLEMEGKDESDGIDNLNLEKEILDLREKLEEERLKVAEKVSLVEELEEQLIASEEMREYEEDIKTRSIENIVQAEMENRKLKQIVEDLRERLSEKDSGIEELIAHCAVEELKLREEIAGLTNQLQVYKRDCVYKANIIERLRRKVESQRTGLETLNEEDEEETEADLLVKTAALERKLHEERLKLERYEEALIDLNKQCEENEETIREKDYELSRQSAEDGKRIAELLQELDSDKKNILELDEQIENLEDILALKDEIEKLEDETDDGQRDQMLKELSDMKQDYAAKKIRRSDELINEMRTFIEELRDQLRTEQERMRKHEDIISDLNDANAQDSKKLNQLTEKIAELEEETTSQKEYIDKLTEKITEGQRLISELEGVADRERMRVSTIEQLLLQDKKEYSQHLVGVQDLKVKVDSYQTNVGEIRSKVERINKNIALSPRDGPEPSSVLNLKGKIKAQKTIIKELKENVSAVEEKNEELDAELKDQKGKNLEQDEKIEKLLHKTLECEDLVEVMRTELELVRKRYRGLSGLPEEEESSNLNEEIHAEIQGELEADPSASLFSYFDDEKENEGDDELEEGESDTVYSSEDQDDQVRSKEEVTRHKEIIRQLKVFEMVFEKIFSEEGVRIDMVIQKFERVIQKNTELLSSLQNVKATLDEARKETERKEDQIEQMKEEFLSIKEELDDTKANNEKIRLALEQEGERALHLNLTLTNEQEKSAATQEQAEILKRLLEDQQDRIDDFESKLSEGTKKVSQLKESLAVELLIKTELECEVEILKSKLMEEQESSERLREELERETNTRYEFDRRMKDIEDEAYSRGSVIEELQKELETERRCYSIVTERLEAEQDKLVELENYVKSADENANSDKTLIEELRASIDKEEQQKNESLAKLQKFERESTEKDQEIDNLMDQLGSERHKMEELVGEIDLEKMAKSTAESKLKELEEYLSRDEQIFEELRQNIDSESAKNRELSELLDKEQERNAEIEEKVRELEKQVLMDLELFEELKTTIEQERAHNRELDALLNEKSSAFNNRDKLLSELDSELTQLKAAVKREQLRNEELNEELKNKTSNEDVIQDLQEMLKSQIVHSEQLDEKAQHLQDRNQEQTGKIEILEKALDRLKELSAQVSKELTDDLEAWGEPLDELDDIELSDLSDDFDYTAERDALRFKALLNNELTIKRNLMANVEEYKGKLNENDVLLSELNQLLKAEQQRVKEFENAVALEKQQKEEIKSLMKVTEDALGTKQKDADTLRNDLEKINVLYSEMVAEKNKEQQRVKEFENAVQLEKQQKEEVKNMMKEIEYVLGAKQNDADVLRADLERVNVLYNEMVAENSRKKIEIEVLSKEIEDREEKQEQFIKELRENIDKMENVLKEKEEESEMLRKYFEEEHKFAKERLEQNQVLKRQVEEMEEKLKENENEIKKLLDEKSGLTRTLEKTNIRFEKQREILVEELKDKTKKNNENVAYIKELQKTVEDLSYSHRRSKDQAAKPTGEQAPTEDTKLHLKEIEDEFDTLETELAQKDEEIAALQKALDITNNNNERSAEIHKEVERLKKEAQEHKERAEKAVKALDKARLLRELLQAQLDIKSSAIHQPHYSTRSEVLSNSKGAVESHSLAKKESTLTVRKVESSNNQCSPDVATGNEGDAVDGKRKEDENEMAQLRDELAQMKATIDNDRKEYERILKAKNKEIEEQSQTIALVKNMYQALQYEVKREKALQDVLPSQETSFEDAKALFKDLENKLEALKQEVTEKSTTIQDLKLYIEELKANKSNDKGVLDRKDKIHRLLSVQLKEKEKKLSRLENLMQNMQKIYGKKFTEECLEESEASKIDSEACDRDERSVDVSPNKISEHIIEASNAESVESPIPMGFEDNKDCTDSPVLLTQSDSVPEKIVSDPVEQTIKLEEDVEVPKPAFKTRVFLYMILAVGLAFLPQFLKLKTMKIVLAFVVTPLFFILSSVEAKLYKKKFEEFVKRRLSSQTKAMTVITDHQMTHETVMAREIQSKEEPFMDKLQEQLQQELQLYFTQKGGIQGNDEVDDFAKQRKRVEDLEKTIREIEKSKINEKEKNQRSYDEYIKLRGEVDELKKKRDQDEKDLLGAKKFDSRKLDSDLSMLGVRPRSLPLWVVLSVVIFYVTNLHPAAPLAVFMLLSLYAVNSWFKIKTIKTKLLNEREINREQNDELEDLTDLLEMEHKVVESQKAAMEIMQREIDNEYVSRKAKSLTLAKMIIQVKELEDMRRAIQDENLTETNDPDLKVAIDNVSKEKADEQVRMYVEMSRKLPDVNSLPNSEAVEDLNETVEDLAVKAKPEETGDEKIATEDEPVKKTTPKSKLLTMAALGLAAFGASLMFKYYLPALLIAMQLVIIIQLFLKHKLLKLSGQLPVTDNELKTKLDKEIKKNKANRQQIGKLRRLLETEKSFKKSDECAKEIQKRVIDRASKRKQL